MPLFRAGRFPLLNFSIDIYVSPATLSELILRFCPVKILRWLKYFCCFTCKILFASLNSLQTVCPHKSLILSSHVIRFSARFFHSRNCSCSYSLAKCVLELLFSHCKHMFVATYIAKFLCEISAKCPVKNHVIDGVIISSRNLFSIFGKMLYVNLFLVDSFHLLYHSAKKVVRIIFIFMDIFSICYSC